MSSKLNKNFKMSLIEQGDEAPKLKWSKPPTGKYVAKKNDPNLTTTDDDGFWSALAKGVKYTFTFERASACQDEFLEKWNSGCFNGMQNDELWKNDNLRNSLLKNPAGNPIFRSVCLKYSQKNKCGKQGCCDQTQRSQVATAMDWGALIFSFFGMWKIASLSEMSAIPYSEGTEDATIRAIYAVLGLLPFFNEIMSELGLNKKIIRDILYRLKIRKTTQQDKTILKKIAQYRKKIESLIEKRGLTIRQAKNILKNRKKYKQFFNKYGLNALRFLGLAISPYLVVYLIYSDDSDTKKEQIIKIGGNVELVVTKEDLIVLLQKIEAESKNSEPTIDTSVSMYVDSVYFGDTTLKELSIRVISELPNDEVE